MNDILAGIMAWLDERIKGYTLDLAMARRIMDREMEDAAERNLRYARAAQRWILTQTKTN